MAGDKERVETDRKGAGEKEREVTNIEIRGKGNSYRLSIALMKLWGAGRGR